VHSLQLILSDVVLQQQSTAIYDNPSDIDTTYDTLIDLATPSPPAAAAAGLPVSLMADLC